MSHPDFDFEYLPWGLTRVERNGKGESGVVLKRGGEHYLFSIYAIPVFPGKAQWYLEFPDNFCILCAESGHCAMVQYVLGEVQALADQSYEGLGRLEPDTSRCRRAGTPLELDCLRIRTRRQVARWAISAFELPRSVDDLPWIEEPALFGSRNVVDIDRITGEIHVRVGTDGMGRSIRLVHGWAASPALRRVLDRWRQQFGVGLPHDFGVSITIDP